MRNAQNAALLAMFAEAERREQEAKTPAPVAAWEQVKRPIVIDLAHFSKNLRKGRA